ncbi:MAG: hypothetical protein WD342_14600 [Verrucomicrobiales bacterium]
MNHIVKIAWLALCAFALPSIVQAGDYTYFIRQIQMPDEVEWDVTVEQSGSQQSPLEINPNGARFELWTVKADPLTSYLLDTTYVNSYIPVAQLQIKSEDPYEVIPRTRADRPFEVEVTVSGLSDDPEAPEAARSVKTLRHVQAYPGDSNGKDLDRGNATLISQGSFDSNGDYTLSYAVTSIPGADRSKVRGEERFSVYSLEDGEAPESQLASEFVQIWPVADGAISGISDGDLIKGALPKVTFDLNDLYPDSWTYAQVYEGQPRLGVDGAVVPGSSILIDSSVPKNNVEAMVKEWDRVVPHDGVWTLELLTATPFGTDRLGYVTFKVERTIRVNGNVTSVD